MQFLDDSLHPENQPKVVITVAPYAPEWMPSDFPEDIPVTMEEQVQKAVDCYEAGARVLHLHVRELDGKGSKRLSKFNELIAGVRAAVAPWLVDYLKYRALSLVEKPRTALPNILCRDISSSLVDYYESTIESIGYVACDPELRDLIPAAHRLTTSLISAGYEDHRLHKLLLGLRAANKTPQRIGSR